VTVAGNLTAPTGYGATTYNDVSLTVTPAILTATLVNAGVTKAYDGTTNGPAGFVPAYSVTGLIAATRQRH